MEEKRQQVRKLLTMALLILGAVCLAVSVGLLLANPAPEAESATPTVSLNEDGFEQMPKKIHKSN